MSAVPGDPFVGLAARLSPDTDPRRLPGRTAATAIAALCVVVLVVSVSAFARSPLPVEPARISLYLDGIAVDDHGRLVAIPVGSGATYLEGTRVVDQGATTRAAADRAWLASARIPGTQGPYADLVEGALLDLRALTGDDGALIAANSRRWRYVWPRDASFGAAALAVAGHPDDARRILVHLQGLQAASGAFEARYLPDGSGATPDDRRAQSDGAGWALWAIGVLLDNLPERKRAVVAAELRPLVDAANEHIAEQTTTRNGLPLPSSDYWETSTDVLTLGTAAPLLAGLESAVGIYGALGQVRDARRARLDADHLRAAVTEHFGRDGYPRHLHGRQSDAATAFLLPPFQPSALDGAPAAWAASIGPMLRPAGGLAPGASWRDDGVSWTPQTALYALAAASTGDLGRAEGWLTWLDEHRTASGALPEKVLADGSPAAVAPLAWTAALVILAVDAMEDARRTPIAG